MALTLSWRADSPSHAAEPSAEETFDLQDHFPRLTADILKLFHARGGRSGVPSAITSLKKVNNRVLEARFNETRRKNPQLKIELAFHGTAAHNIKSIKKRGLLIPGSTIQVANGNSYGRGIYCSTCPIYSLSYMRDESKMFVCALLTGDPRVQHHGNVKVVMDESYVLPCYVMELADYRPSSSHGTALLANLPLPNYLFWWAQTLFFILLFIFATAFVSSFVMVIFYIVGFSIPFLPLVQAYSWTVTRLFWWNFVAMGIWNCVLLNIWWMFIGLFLLVTNLWSILPQLIRPAFSYTVGALLHHVEFSAICSMAGLFVLIAMLLAYDFSQSTRIRTKLR